MTKSLGLPEKEISSEKGIKIRFRSKIVKLGSAYWAIESKLPETRSMDQHLKEIIRKAGIRAELAKNKFGSSVKISLKIGVFFDVATSVNAVCHINLKTIKKLLPFLDTFEISSYPCS